MVLEQPVLLEVAGERYGVDIFGMDSIIRTQVLTKVPHAPSFVEGITNLRGTVLPVIDLRRRFDLPVHEPTKDTCIVVAEMGEPTQHTCPGLAQRASRAGVNWRS